MALWSPSKIKVHSYSFIFWWVEMTKMYIYDFHTKWGKRDTLSIFKRGDSQVSYLKFWERWVSWEKSSLFSTLLGQPQFPGVLDLLFISMLSHCVMCVCVCVCAVPWGVFSTVGDSWVPWGDILSTVGDIMSTVGVILSTGGVILSTVRDVQYRGGIMMHVGGYHEYRGGISWVPWGDIMSTVGGFMIHVGGYHDACGGYHEYRGGCSVPGGYHDACGGYHEYRGGCSVPGGYHDACGGYHEYRGVMINLNWRKSSRILSTSHFMIAILVSAFEIQ